MYNIALFKSPLAKFENSLFGAFVLNILFVLLKDKFLSIKKKL